MAVLWNNLQTTWWENYYYKAKEYAIEIGLLKMKAYDKYDIYVEYSRKLV